MKHQLRFNFFTTANLALVKEISQCRICKGSSFETVVDLGWQALTGIFPREADIDCSPGGPLKLIRCVSTEGCGLVQLAHSFDPNQMYGDNYGYRSGLNTSMVEHLRARVNQITARLALKTGDVVIDIGSNDGTTLGFYSHDLTRIGIDPTVSKFIQFYPPTAIGVSEFFSAKTALTVSEGRQAKVVTSFSMMYDLENPQSFVDEVATILAPNGIWVLEQSYLPLMLERNAFDTICHEHLEYYGICQIDWLLEKSGLEVIDVELNDVNGGSFAVTAAHKGAFPVAESVRRVRLNEKSLLDNSRQRFSEFAKATRHCSEAIKAFVQTQIASGKSVAGLGASTKGNVLLQYSGLTTSEVSVIGDVNPDKYGCVTPGTRIPIKSQKEVLDQNHDYYIVFPWHFRKFFETSPTFIGRRLVFPLPQLSIVLR